MIVRIPFFGVLMLLVSVQLANAGGINCYHGETYVGRASYFDYVKKKKYHIEFSAATALDRSVVYSISYKLKNAVGSVMLDSRNSLVERIFSNPDNSVKSIECSVLYR